MPEAHLSLSADELLSYAYRIGEMDCLNGVAGREDWFVQVIRQYAECDAAFLEAVRKSYRAGYTDCSPERTSRS